MIFVDIDGFKAVNDSYGHLAGDELLSVLAARLRAELRPGDALGRMGGDEFVVPLRPSASLGRSSARRRAGRTLRSSSPAGCL